MSILSLYVIEDFAAWTVIQRSFDAKLFVIFLKINVIFNCTLYTEIRSVIIIDNTRIHHDTHQ
jgi:hypothetical protein